jgi:quercetin dioxygenase-like cupin family protein
MPTNLWFLNTRVMIRVSHMDGSGQASVLEHWATNGDSPPLHLHRNEDEIFCILDGELRFRIGDKEQQARAGDVLLAPKGIPHTYRVESAAGAHWLTITCERDFENFVRAFSRPAEGERLPEPSGPPTPEKAEALSKACLEYGIEIVGPPLT